MIYDVLSVVALIICAGGVISLIGNIILEMIHWHDRKKAIGVLKINLNEEPNTDEFITAEFKEHIPLKEIISYKTVTFDVELYDDYYREKK